MEPGEPLDFNDLAGARQTPEASPIPLLVLRDPKHVSTLRNGAALIVCSWTLGFAAFVALFVGFALLGPAPEAGAGSVSGPHLALGAAFLAGALLSTLGSTLGWWWLTAKPSGDPIDPQPSASRVWVRVLFILTLVMLASVILVPFLLAFGASGAGGDAEGLFALAMGGSLLVSALAWLIAVPAGIALFFTSTCYLRWLARRLPNQTLYSATGHSLWLTPVLSTVGACVFYLGPLAAMILFVVLMCGFWSSLAGVVREQRARAADGALA